MSEPVDINCIMAETIYGTHDDSRVMSERVQNLAAGIYKEFEKLITKYDEDVVKELMPLVVGILEGLNQNVQEKQENDVELELLRDDNEQLLTQYEREKQLRKTADQKCLEVEDTIEEERKQTETKLETIESAVRMYELKAKNAQDHISRMEERESEMKKEFTILHERYTELFKSHMDTVERTKLLMSGDRIMEMGGLSPRSKGVFHLSSLRPVGGVAVYDDLGDRAAAAGQAGRFAPPSSCALPLDAGRSLRDEMGVAAGSNGEPHSVTCGSGVDKEQLTDRIDVRNTSSGTMGCGDGVQNGRSSPLPSHADRRMSSPPSSPLSSSPSSSSSSRPSSHPSSRPSSPAGILADPRCASPVDEDESLSLRPPRSAISHRNIYILDFQYDCLEDDVHSTGDMPLQDNQITSDAGLESSSASGMHSSIFDELSLQDATILGEVDDGVDITGMSKEVENLILENTELLATKNALNVVKDDLIVKVDELSSEQEVLHEEMNLLQKAREKLKRRVCDLEDDLKRSRDDLDAEKKKTSPHAEDEDDVPMAQRKRFTRVEMARVLMERNQYKERLMELQEAVRWAEMIRASRDHPDALPHSAKKRSSMWNFFGNLFSSSNKPTKRSPSGTGSATLKYNAPTSQVRPVGDPNRKERDQYSLGDKSKAYDFMQDEIVNEKSRREREQERKEQYRQVRAHVRKEEDGRLQAYGWSLPAKLGPSPGRDPSRPAHAPVPVPVYCRPLLEDDPDMKLWCAAGLNMSGGWTKDGGVIVGASVFYSRPPSGDATQLQAADNDDDIDKIDQELKDHERSLNEMENEKRSSVIWISTTSHNQSRITIIDANCPADVLEAFPAASSHILCIASVPGAIASDYPSVVDDVVPADSAPDTTTAAETGPVDAAAAADAAGSDADTGSDTGTDAGSSGAAAGAGLIGAVSFVQCATGVTTRTQERADAERADVERADTERADATQAAAVETEEKNGDETTTEPAESPSDVLKVTKATGSPAAHAPTGTGPVPAGTAEPARAGIATATGDGVTSGGPQATSVLPTVWFGSQSGSLYVHSAVSQWKTCLHSVKLTDSILSIIHVKGRVFVGLADGTVAVFQRDSDGLWQLSNYHLIDLGKPHHAIRCMCVVANKTVWCAYRNIVHVIDPNTLKLQKTFSVHPRRESQVRQMAWVGDGVWLSIRLDSTLRLYHAYTHQHLQDVDIEPYVSKMLGTGKLGFSFVRITSLLTSYKRLWIGTGNGVIISIPLSEANKQAMTLATAGRPGGIVRVYGGDAPHDSVTPGSFIPYCSMAQAQLSFHGHRDAVKFFVAVPGAPSKGLSGVTAESGDTQDKGDDPKLTPASPVKNMLVLSGGEGYIDFRIGDAEEDPESPEEENTPPEERRRGEQSHIIVWQVAAPATPTVIASPPVTA